MSDHEIPRTSSRTDGGTDPGAKATAPPTPLTDGGSADEAADGGTVDEVAIDPWGSSTIDDYRKLFEEFGIEEFDEVLPTVPSPHYLMRRGVIFGHREYGPVADAMRKGDPFAVLSGFMPTGDPHIGHKLVFDELVWHQERGGDAYALIADLEAHSARGLSWEEIDAHAESYLLSLLALGFDAADGTLYRQSENRDLQDLAFELGSKANFSEFQSIYGFDGETSVSHMQSVVTQMADILYPQVADEPKPTVIPVGPDQDPHVRFARDLAVRMRYFKVSKAYASFEADAAERALLAMAYDALAAETGDEPVRCEDAAAWLPAAVDSDESTLAGFDAADSATAFDSVVEKLQSAGKEPLRPRVRFFDRNATLDAFEAMIRAIGGEKRVFEGHIDAFDLTAAEAEELAREVEVAHGGYGFIQPSSIYHRFMSGLTGGKMSSSIPASHISLLDDPEDGYDKVKSATTGGRETAELQRELGGEADKCPVYELYAYLLASDDDEFATRVYDECVGGDRLCGDCKEQAARLMCDFLEDHREKREEARELLDQLDIELESTRR
ncbi:tryptophan--tRNA ligase [Haloferacaceae archaeon DSL9]